MGTSGVYRNRRAPWRERLAGQLAGEQTVRRHLDEPAGSLLPATAASSAGWLFVLHVIVPVGHVTLSPYDVRQVAPA